MNETIINEICDILNINEKQVKATLKLLEEGNTIPFIARYRKEVTGALDEEQIRKINEYYEYQVNLFKRKEDVIRLIEEKGLMTEELKLQILEAKKIVEVEDLYRPYKEKKKTKALDAINNGLEPLAKIIMSFPEKIVNIEKYLNDKVLTIEDAITGSKYIIAEWISDNASYRRWIRDHIYKRGTLKSKLKKNAVDDEKIYDMYYEYEETIWNIKPHRILAINRGEKENVLTVTLEYDKERIIAFLAKHLIKKQNVPSEEYVMDAIKDSLNRLILPSLEREIRSDLTEKASLVAIDNFGKNLEKLLLQPPIKEKWVLGLDPAYRTGCKLAVIDPTGKRVCISKIYPHEPVKKYDEAIKITTDLIKKYNIEVVAIGNGTASRESEKFIVDVIKNLDKKIEYVIVSEAGASVYSASKLAIEEFPDLHVEERSAISIGRRLQDPLAELVKIDPQSIGVGLYQHDVPQKKLSETLDFIVSKTVNSVGVNINTASTSLLKYVSGLTKTNIEKIINFRTTNGKITSREEVKKHKLLSDKAYEQAIGFLRVVDGNNKFDMTSIHPESYKITQNLLELLNLTPNDIGSEILIEKLNNLNIEEIKQKLDIDKYTLEDIVESLKKPNRDPRDEMPKPILRSDILELSDLKIGEKLFGTVRNVVDFGAFVDIGLHDAGLIHISKISNNYIKHPSEVLSVGDIVEVYVDNIDKNKKKVSLSLIKN